MFNQIIIIIKLHQLLFWTAVMTILVSLGYSKICIRKSIHSYMDIVSLQNIFDIFLFFNYAQTLINIIINDQIYVYGGLKNDLFKINEKCTSHQYFLKY